MSASGKHTSVTGAIVAIAAAAILGTGLIAAMPAHAASTADATSGTSLTSSLAAGSGVQTSRPSYIDADSDGICDNCANSACRNQHDLCNNRGGGRARTGHHLHKNGCTGQHRAHAHC